MFGLRVVWLSMDQREGGTVFPGEELEFYGCNGVTWTRARELLKHCLPRVGTCTCQPWATLFCPFRA